MKKLVFLIILSAISFFSYAQADELIVKKGDKGLYIDHKVAPKEGLYAVGRLYNVNPKFIAQYNKIGLNDGLNIGQVLHIPLTDTNFVQKGTSGVPVYHRAGSGETLQKISNTYGNISVQLLKDWNELESDNASVQGKKLIVGFLESKEMQWANVNTAVAKAEKKPVEEKKVEEEKQPIKEEPKTVTPPVAKTEIKEEVKKTEPVETKAIVKEEVKSEMPSESGYFKTSFEQQAKATPPTKNSTLNAGIFKTTSGLKEAKYYLLIDGVSPGTIVKVTNPDNNKSVYAKVLGEMNGIRQNQGYDVRICNAAASVLQVNDTDRFVVKVNY